MFRGSSLTFIFILIIFSFFYHGVVSTSTNNNEESLVQFARLKEVHNEQKNKFYQFIKSGKCQHVYLDIGTNIGVQIRKLYQPEGYPNAPILPFFNKSFGDVRTRHKVCSVGFEASRVHTDRLIKLQQAYQDAGYPCVIFTNTAVGTYNGIVEFFHDYKKTAPVLDGRSIEDGATAVRHSDATTHDDAISLDLNAFLHQLVNKFEKVSSNQQPPFARGSSSSRSIVAKLDIEGSEFSVLPHLLVHGSLCLLDAIMIEWHWTMRKFLIKNRALHDIEKMIDNLLLTTNCKVKQVDLDDETYAKDNNVPLPPPLLSLPTPLLSIV